MVLQPGDRPDPTLDDELQAEVWKGFIQAAMMEEFSSKGTENLVRVQKLPKQGVFAIDAINKGKLYLVALSSKVEVVKHDPKKQNQVPAGCIGVGECFKGQEGAQFIGIIRSDLRFPASSAVAGAYNRRDIKTCVPSFWATQGVWDPEVANCERIKVTVSIKLGKSKYDVNVTAVQNTKALQKDQEILYLKKGDHVDEDELDNRGGKFAKTGTGKGGKQGVAKGKGKAKTKGGTKK